jgi:uncharacterized protein YcbX
VAKPCARCPVVDIDQYDGCRTAEPLRTLAGYRSTDGQVLFGQNLVHRGSGRLQTGDQVTVVDEASRSVFSPRGSENRF